MSTTPTSSPQPSTGPTWLLIVGSLLGFCAVAAGVAADSGLSEPFARAHPDLPPLSWMPFIVIPAAGLAVLAGYAAFRGLMKAGLRSPWPTAFSVVLAVGLLAAAVARAELRPTSPARMRGPVAYYDIPGDASVLEAHVTLPPGTVVAGGTRQLKVFLLRNAGSVPWIDRWLCRSDPEMNTRDNLRTPECVPIPTTPAGQTVEVRVPVKVADRNGVLVAMFKMSDGRGAWYYSDATPVHIRLNVQR